MLRPVCARPKTAVRSASAVAKPEFGTPVEVAEHRDAGIVTIDVPLAGDGADGTSRRALDVLRDEIVLATVGPAALGAGSSAQVTGELAGSVDFDDARSRSLVPVLGFLGLVTLVLMLLAFRSPVIAATAIGLNRLLLLPTVMIVLGERNWALPRSLAWLPGARSETPARTAPATDCDLAGLRG